MLFRNRFLLLLALAALLAFLSLSLQFCEYREGRRLPSEIEGLQTNREAPAFAVPVNSVVGNESVSSWC